MYVMNKDDQLVTGYLNDLMPETSFKAEITDAELAEIGIFKAVEIIAIDATKEKQQSCSPKLINGQYFVVEAVPLNLAERKTAKLNVLNNVGAAKIVAGFTYQDNVYDIDDNAQSNMIAVMVRFLMGATNAHGGSWRTMDDKAVVMTDNEVKAFIVAAYAFGLSIVTTKHAIKDVIAAAKDIPAIDAIAINL